MSAASAGILHTQVGHRAWPHEWQKFREHVVALQIWQIRDLAVAMSVVWQLVLVFQVRNVEH